PGARRLHRGVLRAGGNVLPVSLYVPCPFQRPAGQVQYNTTSEMARCTVFAVTVIKQFLPPRGNWEASFWIKPSGLSSSRPRRSSVELELECRVVLIESACP